MIHRKSIHKQGGIKGSGNEVILLLTFLVLLLAVPVTGQEAKTATDDSLTIGLSDDGQDTPVDVVVEGGDATSVLLDDEFTDVGEDWVEDETFTAVVVSDPLEPMNRVFFNFNDKLYFWFIKPLAKGFNFVVPKPARKCLANVFYNLETPIRLVNCLLQGKITSSGRELTRFLINSTVGVAGLWDPARDWFDLKPKDEDFGQTLGKYGLGEGVYICLPIFGPSNIRDAVGRTGDYFLDPISWATLTGDRATREAALVTGATRRLSNVSVRVGDYEDFKKATFDPYSAMRDAYALQRRSKIKD